VAVAGCAGMSDEIADYYQDSLTLWAKRNVQPRWHFTFPHAYPAASFRLYGWGSIGNFFGLQALAAYTYNNYGGGIEFWEPNTEEFYRAAFCVNPIRFTCLSATGRGSDANGRRALRALGCDEEGRLWCFGTSVEYAGNTAGLKYNPHGLGVKQEESLQVDPEGARPRRNLRSICAQVYGDGGDLMQERFVKAQAYLSVSGALSEDGSIWLSGQAGKWAAAANFPLDTNSDLPFFRKLVVTQYRDEWMNLVTAPEPLAFTDFWLGESLLAMTANGDLYICGTGSVVSSTTFHKVSGFVDSVTLTSGGSGYTSNPTATASAPPSPNGVAATFSVVRTGNAVTAIRITNPGRGYGDTAPTITFSGGGGSGASATCQVFTGGWLSASAGMFFTSCSAVSQQGSLYTWGIRSLWNVDPGLFADPFNLSGFLFPVRAYDSTGRSYARVSSNVALDIPTNDPISIASLFPVRQGPFGLLLTGEGEVAYWGEASQFVKVSPDGLRAASPKLLSSVSEIGAKRFVDISCGHSHAALLDEEGNCYTYGNLNDVTTNGLGHGYLPGSTDGTIRKVVGNAKWTRVFAGSFATLALRDEELDERGNRLNPLPPIAAS
jgi:hypothetical protein